MTEFDLVIAILPIRGRPLRGNGGYDPKQRHERYERDIQKEPKQWNGTTYGEVWFEHLNHPDYFKSEDFGKNPSNCPKRMPKKEATRYYKAKLNNVWDELYPVKPSDFLNSDDYFDYHEARRVVNNLGLGMEGATFDVVSISNKW